ncbi:DUF58 domain-containing protein [Ferrimonas balearica]|uniref:DUF58 domain-containing protein n=1 Tax=Ferrimonas balearica TaxID=44012 RepID=UPI001C9497E8|nr:DUF58 domain-containing protein [Ferrimonas balearica]MBY6224731.1 DUF58 domain-containing protein [Ferrimonas balearica]
MAAPSDLPRHGDGVTLTLPELLARAEHRSLVQSHHSGQARALMAGERLSRLKGRGMEFSEVRGYQPGDDVRTIDWRVTARTGKAHTKLFREERERPVLLCVDLGQRMHYGSELLLQSVQAAHLAALLGWHVSAEGDRLGGLILSERGHRELKPRARRSGLLALLEALVELHPGDDSEDNDYWSAGLQRLERLARPGTTVVVITNTLGLDSASLERLARLKRHAEVRVFNITDPLFDRLKASRGLLPVRQSHSGQSGWLSRERRDALANHWHQAQANALNGVRQRQLIYSEISATQPLEQQWRRLWL